MSIKCGADKRDEILRQTAKEYSEYLEVDATSETRSESRHTLDVLVPQVYSNYQALQRTFQNIDHLEMLVKRVKEDLVKMETSVNQAEADLGTSHSFTTVIRPLFFKKDQYPVRTPTSSQLSFQPPQIFHAEDYFTRDVQKTDASSLMLPQ
ncbi:biogenesis of lysosome-related organelles complex 1 subunit 4 isoform X3 [Cherax quadricarinatus]|uniref:biogenesis of lysosome-related organelles complex 1 subunit 4 isoform X3 n=1 Tax=Cherax quadricarinatus TaxID=27406 RepID=UPI00387E6722